MNPDLTQLNSELDTTRLYLRPLNLTDAQAMWPYSSNIDFPKYMTWNAHEDIEETKSYIRASKKEAKDGKGLIWSIFYQNDFSGVVGFHDIDWRVGACETRVSELGYWLIPKLWGQGVMVEAAQVVLRFGFDKINLHKVKTGHISKNKQSQRVIEKLGFRFIGEEKERLKKNGIWYHHMNYELLKREFIDNTPNEFDV